MNNAGFFKRILVLIYDGLLMAGVVLVAYVPIYLVVTLLPDALSAGIVGDAIKIIYLAIITFFFYGWFWTHGGQTLGMRAWHLYLIKPNGKFPSWTESGVRYLVAACSWGLVPLLLWRAGVQYWYLTIGLGFSWMLLNPGRLTWHDILSNTRIVRVPPKKKP